MKFLPETYQEDVPVLGKIGSLETRLVRSREEVLAAQQLRHDVFFSENTENQSPVASLSKRDADHFDAYCDHLLVLDTSLSGSNQIVGTYRLMDHEGAHRAGGFYTETEFDISALIQHGDQRVMELGRSCIAPTYRSRRTIELMWQGIWSLVTQRRIDVMFGCASFVGCDPQDHKVALSWLGQNVLFDEATINPTDTSNAVELSGMRSVDSNLRDFAKLPPLLKGYIRLGAKVAPHAVIDSEFGTTDVLVVLPVADIEQRYISHYGADASRFAA